MNNPPNSQPSEPAMAAAREPEHKKRFEQYWSAVEPIMIPDSSLKRQYEGCFSAGFIAGQFHTDFGQTEAAFTALRAELAAANKALEAIDSALPDSLEDALRLDGSYDFIGTLVKGVAHLRAELAAKGEWQTGTPDIPSGSERAFWVAFKSGDKIRTRFLTYCNALVMPVSDQLPDDHEPKDAVPVGDDGEYAWTGWFEFSCENCETYWAFNPEVIAWMELPEYSSALSTRAAGKEEGKK